MSFCIDPRTVTSVTLGGETIPVERGTFDLDAYEFVDGADNLGPGGLGVAFISREGERIFAPIASVEAVAVWPR